MGKKAKKTDILDFLRNIVTVNSNAYKKHVRAKRGTYTAISLPEALKTNSDSQKIVNRQAKLVFDRIKEIAPQFKNSKLWPRLLSALRKNGSAANGCGYFGLDGFEVRKDYPSDLILGLIVDFKEEVPIFDYNLPSDYEVDIHMCILEVDATFEHVLASYEWFFRLEDSLTFDFKDIEQYRVEDGVCWPGFGEEGAGSEEDVSAIEEVVGDGGSGFKDAFGGLSAEVGGTSEGDDIGDDGRDDGSAMRYIRDLDEGAQLQVREFVYDSEKKGRYVAIISVNKILNGNADTGLDKRGMKLVGL